jgi:hypothetical protein
MKKLKKVIVRTVKYSAPGCCIYCGSSGDPDLQDEHIIPDAILGRYLFQRASCHECENKTHAVEGRIIASLYGDSRAYLGMRRGHHRKWPKTFSVHVKSSDSTTIGNAIEPHESIEEFTRKEIAIGDYPSPFVSVNLPPAGIVLRTQPDDTNSKPHSLNISTPPDFKERVKRIGDRSRVLLGGGRKLRREDFGRFLAKIGHSYAVATLGIGSFIPFLTKAIRNERPMYLSHYVGGALANTPVLPTEYLHTLQVGLCRFDSGEKLVNVRIRLFAVDGFPAYDLIVGEATRATPLA